MSIQYTDSDEESEPCANRLDANRSCFGREQAPGHAQAVQRLKSWTVKLSNIEFFLMKYSVFQSLQGLKTVEMEVKQAFMERMECLRIFLNEEYAPMPALIRDMKLVESIRYKINAVSQLRINHKDQSCLFSLSQNLLEFIFGCSHFLEQQFLTYYFSNVDGQLLSQLEQIITDSLQFRYAPIMGPILQKRITKKINLIRYAYGLCQAFPESTYPAFHDEIEHFQQEQHRQILEIQISDENFINLIRKKGQNNSLATQELSLEEMNQIWVDKQFVQIILEIANHKYHTFDYDDLLPMIIMFQIMDNNKEIKQITFENWRLILQQALEKIKRDTAPDLQATQLMANLEKIFSECI